MFLMKKRVVEGLLIPGQQRPHKGCIGMKMMLNNGNINDENGQCDENNEEALYCFHHIEKGTHAIR